MFALDVNVMEECKPEPVVPDELSDRVDLGHWVSKLDLPWKDVCALLAFIARKTDLLKKLFPEKSGAVSRRVYFKWVESA